MTIVIIAVIVVIVGIAAAGVVEYNKRSARAAFGPEYEALVEQEGGRRAADREIVRRRRAYSKLVLRPLVEEEHVRNAQDWRRAQESFVDDPAAALGDADALVLRLARSRGYPGGDRDTLVELLSIPHTAVVTGYRDAMQVRDAAEKDPQSVSTEQMRQAFRGYGAIFEDILAASAAEGSQRTQSTEPQEALSLEEQR